MNTAGMFGLPVIGIVGSVIKVGGNVLNPDVKLADLKRTEVQMREGHKALGEEISQLKVTLGTLNDSFAEYKSVSLKLARDLRFKTDWEDIEAAHNLLLSAGNRMDETMKDIQLLLPAIKIKYVKSMSTCKIKEYVRLVNETEGAKEARATLSYAVLVKAMYLNLVISVAVYKGEMESISVDVEQFNSGLREMEQVFIAIEGEGSRKK